MKVAVLGSTGSIGLQTLDVCRKMSPRPELVLLSANTNAKLLIEQAEELGVKRVVLHDENAWKESRNGSDRTDILPGSELEHALRETTPDVTVNGIWGTAGLEPTLAALKHSRRLALANKESLVSAGEIVMKAAKEMDCPIVPIDSEQSAIFQAMQGGKRNEVRRVILTASGGPFLDWSPEQIAAATPQDALKHPTWEMGHGISVDSATLMNKAFEVIEAKWLFDLDPAQIEVVIHPESIVHSMVEFIDGSCLAQLSVTDMRLPIQYALTCPGRSGLDLEPLQLHEVGSLNFRKPDLERFPALSLAWKVLEMAGTAGAALVAANQRATAAFLDGKKGFNSISETAAKVLQSLSVVQNPALDDILATHDWARAEADKWVSQES
jgi:1-deoxy-D-xylulose-5-phosphate reductoisomerase